MPNNVMNRIKVVNGMERFLDKFYDAKKNCLDFNKIIPMPDEIASTVCGSYQDDAIAIYTGKPNNVIRKMSLKHFISEMFDSLDPDGFHNMLPYMSKTSQEIVENSNGKTFTKDEVCKLMYDIGKIYCDNNEKYGSTDWYSWSVKNWGTQWNSYNASLNEAKDELKFLTAWTKPMGIYSKLHDMGYRFTVYFADECFDNDGGLIDATGSKVVITEISDEPVIKRNKMRAIWS